MAINGIGDGCVTHKSGQPDWLPQWNYDTKVVVVHSYRRRYQIRHFQSKVGFSILHDHANHTSANAGALTDVVLHSQ